MTQNYKWYRLLTREEYRDSSWFGLLSNHGYDRQGTYHTFAPWLLDKCGNAKDADQAYKFYVEWWTTHFGTKLHKHLAGVENVD